MQALLARNVVSGGLLGVPRCSTSRRAHMCMAQSTDAPNTPPQPQQSQQSQQQPEAAPAAPKASAVSLAAAVAPPI
jgi:hypothetical protein